MGEKRTGFSIGVSPAYFISRYTDRFSWQDVAECLADIARLGFDGFQLEIYHNENLDRWRSKGAVYIRNRSTDLGLTVSQFVAHFMIKAFSNPYELASDEIFEHMRSVVEIVEPFDECRVITIPLGPFETPAGGSNNEAGFFLDQVGEKIRRLIEMAEVIERKIALEIMPSAVIDGMEGFHVLCERLGTEGLGLNFDTGHTWASMESLYDVPSRLGSRILGTHLCDNFGKENLSLGPGKGSIDWPRLISELISAGYPGSFDVEIICAKEDTEREYKAALGFIQSLLQVN